MLGTAVFQHFARSQSWERLFLPFSCVPKVGNNRFSRICLLPKLGTPVFAIFMCSQSWEQPFLCVYESPHPLTFWGYSAVKVRSVDHLLFGFVTVVFAARCHHRDARGQGDHEGELE